jgi:hypothetical protein
MDFILENAEYFPCVDTLTFCLHEDIPPRIKFWRRLPHLISLRIEGRYIRDLSDRITLHRLKILITGLRDFPDSSFPSLRHLVLPHTSFPSPAKWKPAASNSYFGLLRRHSQQLKSLILLGNFGLALFFRDTFWRLLPSLRLFGIKASRLSDVLPPKIT